MARFDLSDAEWAVVAPLLLGADGFLYVALPTGETARGGHGKTRGKILLLTREVAFRLMYVC